MSEDPRDWSTGSIEGNADESADLGQSTAEERQDDDTHSVSTVSTGGLWASLQQAQLAFEFLDAEVEALGIETASWVTPSDWSDWNTEEFDRVNARYSFDQPGEPSRPEMTEEELRRAIVEEEVYSASEFEDGVITALYTEMMDAAEWNHLDFCRRKLYDSRAYEEGLSFGDAATLLFDRDRVLGTVSCLASAMNTMRFIFLNNMEEWQAIIAEE